MGGHFVYPRHVVAAMACRLPWAMISGYHVAWTRDSARVSGDVWYNSGLPLSTRIDTLCMWHQSRIGARPSAQCGARHAPRRGREGGVRARRRADPLEAPVRGALCPARGRHARTPTDAPDRGAPDQPPGRAGGAARRAAPNASFDLTRRGRVVAPRVVQNRDRVLWDSDARPGGRGRRRRTSSGDCRQSSRGEAGP